MSINSFAYFSGYFIEEPWDRDDYGRGFLHADAALAIAQWYVDPTEFNMIH